LAIASSSVVGRFAAPRAPGGGDGWAVREGGYVDHLMPLASGIELPERYRVTRHIASGGMASVWEVEDLLLGRVVAVKVLSAHFAADPGARARFQREARTAARVSEHPHIATIYDTGEHGDDVYIVMEYFSGGTVADRLRAVKDGGDPVPRETTLRWLKEAALALDAAHAADIVHRDVKPANLLIDAQERLAVGDFGIARLADDTHMTQTGQVLGTAAYLSPEQALGQPATAASDRYALAVVAYELLTGTRPFAGGPVTAQARQHVEDEPEKATEADPALPEAVDAVFERGLAKDPRDRPQTAVALVEELERALGATAPTKRVDPKRAIPPVVAAAAPSSPVPPAAPTQGGRQREPTPARTPAKAAADPHRRRPMPWLPIGVGAAALAAVIVAIVLASSGDGGGDGNRTASTPKKSPSSSTSSKQPASSSQNSTPPAAPPPPPAASTGTGASTGGSTTGTSPVALNNQGYRLQQAGDNEAALPLLQRAVKAFKAKGDTSSTDYSYAIYNLGVSLVALNRGAEAIPYLEERLNNFDDRDEIVRRTLAKAKAQAGTGGQATNGAEG
jgi:serine/threonine-protein kinase